MIESLRTPDEHFNELPDWPFAPRYLDDLSGYEGLRIHYVDEGPSDGATSRCLYGESTWSYLYRTMIAIVFETGTGRSLVSGTRFSRRSAANALRLVVAILLGIVLAGCESGNRSPVVSNPVSATTAEDVSLTISIPASDRDNDPLTLTIVDAPDRGQLTVIEPMIVRYDPEPDSNGPDQARLAVSDGRRVVEFDLLLEITPVNDPPVAAADDVAATYQRSIDLMPVSNDSDVDGDALTLATAMLSGPGLLSMSAVDTLTFTPAPEFLGAVTIDYTVTDGVATTAGRMRVTVGLPIIAVAGESQVGLTSLVRVEAPNSTNEILELDPNTAPFLRVIDANALAARSAIEGVVAVRFPDQTQEVFPSQTSLTSLTSDARGQLYFAASQSINRAPSTTVTSTTSIFTSAGPIDNLSVDGDGALVAYTRHAPPSNARVPFVVDVAAQSERLALAGATTDLGTLWLQFSGDGSRLILHADNSLSGILELYSLDISDWSVSKINPPILSNAGIASPVLINAGQQVAYLTDFIVDDQFLELYVSPLDQQQAHRVNNELAVFESVDRFIVDDRLQQIAYLARESTDPEPRIRLKAYDKLSDPGRQLAASMLPAQFGSNLSFSRTTPSLFVIAAPTGEPRRFYSVAIDGTELPVPIVLPGDPLPESSHPQLGGFVLLIVTETTGGGRSLYLYDEVIGNSALLLSEWIRIDSANLMPFER